MHKRANASLWCQDSYYLRQNVPQRDQDRTPVLHTKQPRPVKRLSRWNRLAVSTVETVCIIRESHPSACKVAINNPETCSLMHISLHRTVRKEQDILPRLTINP